MCIIVICVARKWELKTSDVTLRSIVFTNYLLLRFRLSSKLRDILESHGNKYLEYFFPFFLVVNHGWSYKSHMWSFLVVDECKKPKIAFLGNRKENGENDSIFKAEIHSSKTNVVQEQNDWFLQGFFCNIQLDFALQNSVLGPIQEINAQTRVQLLNKHRLEIFQHPTMIW